MYLSGPIFFGTQEQMTQVLDELDDSLEAIIFSMRGVPSIDDSCIHEFFVLLIVYKKIIVRLNFQGFKKKL